MKYESLGKELIGLLGLKGSPVAVKLAKTPADVPAGYQKVAEKHRHCQFVQDARLKGTIGYATREEHLCKGGAAVMVKGEERWQGSIRESRNLGNGAGIKGRSGEWAWALLSMKPVSEMSVPLQGPPGDRDAHTPRF